MRFSRNFTREELVFTRHDVDNTPNAQQESRLRLLANAILQPLRDHFGVLIVTNAFRSEALNVAIYFPREPLRTSYHLSGDAADVIAADDSVTPEDMQRFLALSSIAFDKAIVERIRGRAWLHVQQAKEGRQPRRACYFTSDGVSYTPITFNSEG